MVAFFTRVLSDSLLTVRVALLSTPPLPVALLNAAQLYMPLSVAKTEAITRVLVRFGVVSDFFSVPLKYHFQTGVG